MVDVPGDFPNSRMAQATRLGQSRFRHVEGVVAPGTYNANAKGTWADPAIVPQPGTAFANQATQASIAGSLGSLLTTFTNYFKSWFSVNNGATPPPPT